VRTENRVAMERLLDAAFARKTRAEWQQLFREARMRCDPCLTYEEVCAHPQLEANDIIYKERYPSRGEVRMLGVPVRLSRTPGRPQGPAPRLGEHTAEILKGLGYSPRAISALEAEGIIRTAGKKA